MAESVGDKLTRVRPPRVHIKYDVEIGDAVVTRELPFVMAVLGEFTSNSEEASKKLKERAFEDVDLENFDQVLGKMAPRVTTTVPNRLQPQGGNLAVDVTFRSLNDFSPERIAEQVEPLKDLLDLRRRLAELRGSLDGNDGLDALLQSAIANTESMSRLKDELNRAGGSNG